MKTVLITGASRGIGAACAKRFAKAGYRVYLNYKSSEDAARSLCAELNAAGCEAAAVRADVSVASEVNAMFEAILPPDVLINNAGIAEELPFPDISEAAWDRMMAVNLKSVYLCSAAALRTMLPRHAGVIVNVSSVWGLYGGACEVHYSAAKAGVIGLTKALAKEMGPNGIRINCVAPGVIDTEMNGNLSEADLSALREQTPLCRIGTAEEAADAIFFAAEHPFLTGTVLEVGGGFGS